MESIFAIGDVHGEFERLQTLLKKWNPDKERIVFLGDLMDRGSRSYDVLRLAMQLKQNYGAVVLQGNHDEMFLSWLDVPEMNIQWYYRLGGIETVRSFIRARFGDVVNETMVDDFSCMNSLIPKFKERFSDEIDFMKQCPDYFEWDKYVFVHAGVNLNKRDWKNTSSHDFHWIRELFHFGRNDTDKTFVFGHTQTYLLHPNKSCEIWMDNKGTKIGIDGGAVYGGLLHGLAVSDDGTLRNYSVDPEYDVYMRDVQIVA